MKRIIVIFGIIAVVGAAGIFFLTQHVILNGASVKTPESQGVDQQIVQHASSSASDSPTPVFSSDVVVKNIKYFDGKTWLVATVDQKSAPGNFAYVVMQLQNDSWQVVAGPGTDFAGVLPGNTPSDVTKYLNTAKN